MQVQSEEISTEPTSSSEVKVHHTGHVCVQLCVCMCVVYIHACVRFEYICDDFCCISLIQHLLCLIFKGKPCFLYILLPFIDLDAIFYNNAAIPNPTPAC